MNTLVLGKQVFNSNSASETAVNNRNWRETAECILLVGSGVGSIASVFSQQVLLAAAPLSCSLLLSWANRRRFEQQMKQNIKSTVAQLDQRLATEVSVLQQTVQDIPSFLDLDSLRKTVLQRQQESLDAFATKTLALKQEVIDEVASITDQKVGQIRQDICELQEQQDSLLESFDRLGGQIQRSLAASKHYEQTMAQFQTELAQMRSDLRQVANDPKISWKALQEQIDHFHRRLNNLPSPFDASALKQDVESLMKVVAGLVPRREFAQVILEVETLHHQHQAIEQTAASIKLAISIFRKQMDGLYKKVNASSDAEVAADLKQSIFALEQRLDQLPTFTQLLAVEAELEAKVAEDLEQLQQQINHVQQGTQTLNYGQKKLQEQIQHLPQALALSALQQQMQGLTTRVSGVESEISNLQAEIKTTVRSSLAEIQQQLPASPLTANSDLVFSLNRSQSAQVGQSGLGSGSGAFLAELLQQAQSQLMVVWPWPTPDHLNDAVIEKFRNFLDRGGTLRLGLGHLGCLSQDRLTGYISPRLASGRVPDWLYGVLRQLTQLKRDYPGQLKFKVLGTDEDFLVCDRSLAILGVPNLSITNTVFPQLELGLRTTDTQVIESLFDRFENPELEAGDATAYFNRASTLSVIGDKAGAIADYTRVLQIQPNDDVAYNNRGLAHYDQGDVQAAIADFSQALDINPENLAAYCNRGFVRFDLGDRLGAIEDYSQAIEINSQVAAIYFYRGLARTRLGNKLGAIEDYNQAIQLDPADAAAYFYRGLARTKLGDLRAAMTDLQQAAQHFSQQGDRDNYQRATATLLKLESAMAQAYSA